MSMFYGTCVMLTSTINVLYCSVLLMAGTATTTPGGVARAVRRQTDDRKETIADNRFIRQAITPQRRPMSPFHSIISTSGTHAPATSS